MSVLAYLEWRQLVNRIRTALRHPGRAVLYLFAIAYFVLMLWLRSHSHSRQPQFTSIADPYASAILFAFVAFLGVIAYGAASGIVGAFSSSADARFLSGSQLGERSVVTWLQLRRSAAAILRGTLGLFLYLALSAPNGAFGKLAGAFLGGTLLSTGAAIPVLKLRARLGARTAQTIGAVLIAAGLLPIAILMSSLIQPAWYPWAAQIEHWGAGTAVNALFGGNAVALIALYAVAALLLAISFLCGTDLYPELYSASLRVAAYRQRRRRPDFVTEQTFQRTSSNSGRLLEGLRGAWTVAWKEWIAFVRSPSMRRMFLFGAIACVAGGVVFGRIAVNSNDRLAVSISLGATSANALVIFVAFASSVGLAADLRKPLWWMGPDSLWMRLFAWTLATSWRMAVCIGLGLIAWAAMLHLAIFAFAGIPIAIAAVIYLRSSGLALYAINPYGFDQRGPMAMLRVMLTYLFAIPPIVAAIVTAVVLHHISAGIVAGIAVALGEALILITFAAARISGRGVAYAQGELG